MAKRSVGNRKERLRDYASFPGQTDEVFDAGGFCPLNPFVDAPSFLSYNEPKNQKETA